MLDLIKPKRFFHPFPQAHFKQKWHSGDRIRVWYLIYQLAGCLFLFGCVIKTWIDQAEKGSESWKYVIFMTNWGIVTINFAVLIETCLTIYIYLKLSRADKPSEGLKRILHVSWGLSHITYTAAITITFLYWGLLFDWGKETLTWNNFYAHAAQGIYSLIDQFMSARPWEGGHWWAAIPFLLLYAVFNISYWAAGGTNENGEDFIYPILDWSDSPGYAVGYLIAALFVVVGSHYLFVLVTWVRDWLHSKFF